MDEYTQLLFMQWLAALTGAKTEEELLQIMQLMGLEGLQQAYALFLQDPQVQLALQALAQYAKLGAKISYISRLRGNCPEGYLTQYYKAGGRVCKKCVRKGLRGTEMNRFASDLVGQQAVNDYNRDFSERYNNELLNIIGAAAAGVGAMPATNIAHAAVSAGKLISNMIDDKTKLEITAVAKQLIENAGGIKQAMPLLKKLFDKYRQTGPKSTDVNAMQEGGDINLLYNLRFPTEDIYKLQKPNR